MLAEKTRKIAVGPNRGELPKGTLRVIIKEANLDVEEFLALL